MYTTMTGWKVWSGMWEIWQQHCKNRILLMFYFQKTAKGSQESRNRCWWTDPLFRRYNSSNAIMQMVIWPHFGAAPVHAASFFFLCPAAYEALWAARTCGKVHMRKKTKKPKHATTLKWRRLIARQDRRSRSINPSMFVLGAPMWAKSMFRFLFLSSPRRLTQMSPLLRLQAPRQTALWSLP